MTDEQYREKWLKLHRRYERLSYTLLMKVFRDLGNSIPFDRLTKLNYEYLIDFAVKRESIEDVYLNIYRTIGFRHGLLIGKSINRDLKNFTPNVFSEFFEGQLKYWILNNIAYRITSVRNEYALYIKQIIKEGLDEGLGMLEVAKKIEKLINSRNFYRWQALRIARTETGAAANYGATISANSTNVMMDKFWISANDARTRRTPPNRFDHFNMNGAKVDKLEPFNVGGELLMYPNAPITADNKRPSGGNVINCRCTIGYRPKRDKDGRVITG